MSEEWYYMSNGQQQGPISAIALRQMASVGMLLPEDMVTKSGMASWVPASRVKGLFQVSAQVSPSTASPPASVPPNQSQPQSPSNSTNSINQFPPPLPSNSGPNLVAQMPASPLPSTTLEPAIRLFHIWKNSRLTTSRLTNLLWMRLIRIRRMRPYAKPS